MLKIHQRLCLNCINAEDFNFHSLGKLHLSCDTSYSCLGEHSHKFWLFGAF